MPDRTLDEICVPICRDTDVVVACHKGRKMAAELGLSSNDQVIIVVAIAEVARNIVRYAYKGEIILASVQQNGQYGIVVVARDEGPGIFDVEQALQDGYSTGGGLGMGLPGAKRLMDEFEIVSQVGIGTMVTMKKWKR